MELLVGTISMETKNLNDKGVRLEAIGDLKSLPEICQHQLQESINITSKNNKVTLILALSYSSKWEITNSVKEIAKERSLTVGTIENHLANYITSGDIDVLELIELKRYKKILHEIEEAGDVKGLTSLKEKVDPSITYMELKMVLMSMES